MEKALYFSLNTLPILLVHAVSKNTKEINVVNLTLMEAIENQIEKNNLKIYTIILIINLSNLTS